MPSKRTPEQMAAYQKARRERLAKTSTGAAVVAFMDLTAKGLRRPGDDDAMAERRVRIARGARSNYVTGDFVAEVSAMTQHQRDAILNRMPKMRKGE